MSTQIEVIVRPKHDGNVVEFHIKGARLTEEPYVEYFLAFWDKSETFSVLSPQGRKIAQELLAEGKLIEKIAFRPESVSVRRTPSADWGEVEEDSVMPAIKEALGSDITVTQHGTPKITRRQHATA